MDIDGSGDKPKDTSTSKVITIYNTETWKPHIVSLMTNILTMNFLKTTKTIN